MEWNKSYVNVDKMKQAFEDGGIPFHDGRSWEVLIARRYDDDSGWFYFIGHYIAPCEFNERPIWLGAAVDYDGYGACIKYTHAVRDTDMWTRFESPEK